MINIILLGFLCHEKKIKKFLRLSLKKREIKICLKIYQCHPMQPPQEVLTLGPLGILALHRGSAQWIQLVPPTLEEIIIKCLLGDFASTKSPHKFWPLSHPRNFGTANGKFYSEFQCRDSLKEEWAENSAIAKKNCFPQLVGCELPLHVDQECFTPIIYYCFQPLHY